MKNYITKKLKFYFADLDFSNRALFLENHVSLVCDQQLSQLICNRIDIRKNTEEFLENEKNILSCAIIAHETTAKRKAIKLWTSSAKVEDEEALLLDLASCVSHLNLAYEYKHARTYDSVNTNHVKREARRNVIEAAERELNVKVEL